MKKFIIQIVALVIILIVAVSITFGSQTLPSFLNFGGEQISVSKLKIGSETIDIEIANTPALRGVGLGGRDSLASGSGMLFEFPQPGKYRFWMKDMRFPLDFVWISGGRVVDLLKNVPNPSPNQSVDSLPVYEPTSPVDQVLEVNAGFIDAHGLKIGDPVSVINDQPES